MTARLAHRGPDGQGVHTDAHAALGHRRLAIIDVAGGHQPLSNEDATVWVVFNGEIYNHHDLRARLEGLGHEFRTRSDTEAIVHAWDQYGPACVEHFHGMFAFVIWDTRRRELFAARDRLGKKPLFYAELARPFFKKVLGDIDRFCMQTEESRRRVIDIGADPADVVVTGSLKFDSLDMPGTSTRDGRGQNRVLRYFRMTSGRPVIVVGSTMREEEQLVLQAFRRIKASTANPLLVLAPRHPERFAEVAQLARDQAFVTVRRSDLQIDAESRADVVVLDTIGELAQVYQIATAVFVGGSLVDTGGHNLLEPAVFGKPIIFGLYMHNFKEKQNVPRNRE